MQNSSAGGKVKQDLLFRLFASTGLTETIASLTFESSKISVHHFNKYFKSIDKNLELFNYIISQARIA